jgi:hypothetical protein
VFVTGELSSERFDSSTLDTSAPIITTIMTPLLPCEGLEFPVNLECSFRREAERHSGMIPNTIGA